MKVSLNWLNDYVGINVPLEELCDKMVMSGFEVEGVEDLSKTMKKVFVGKINKIEKHPDADRLIVCRIDIGENEDLQIVTGAANVFENALVPVAIHGSLLPNGMKIKKGKLRGVESFGMLCSGEELMITESDYPGAEVEGILIIKEDTKVGTDMRDVLRLRDVIIDFAITANRPDCQSVLGIAREISVALNTKFAMPLDEGPTRYDEDEEVHELMKVDIEDKELCTRYMGTVVRNVKLAPSPNWMKERLKSAGMRPISNIVDITNFVMLETGQPMHAFDLTDVAGSHIIVRRAKKDEKIKLIDKTEHKLTEDMLVIADEIGPSAIAGVMGGFNSEIKDDTADIFFECAQFKRDSIRRTSRTLGLRTESSARFEKGTDIYNVKYAMDRALQLVELLNVGEIVEGYIDENDGIPELRELEVSAQRITALLGIDIPADEMIKILNSLEIETVEKDGILNCQVPSFRGDIAGEADIAEEVMRVYGYEHITAQPLEGDITRGHVPYKYNSNGKIKNALKAQGYYEISTYSFVSKNTADKLCLAADDKRRTVIPILNPLIEDYGVMRTELISSMLKVIEMNSNHKIGGVRYFEIGKTFITDELPIKKQPKEKQVLCIGSYGKGEDFFTMKGAVESALAIFGKKAEYTRSSEPYLHDGRQAHVIVDGKKVGVLGEIHYEVMDIYDFDMRVYVASVELEELYVYKPETVIYKPLPKYPAVERDLALVCDYDMPVVEIEKVMKNAGGKYLESVELFDVYTGAQILSGKKSVAYALRFRSHESTLTDKEVDKTLENIFKDLEKAGCVLRS